MFDAIRHLLYLLNICSPKQENINTNTNNYNINRKTFKSQSKTVSCRPKYFHEPRNIEEIKAILSFARLNNETVSVCGSRHSPSNNQASKHHLINMKKMNKIIEVDSEHCIVTVEAGIILSDLIDILIEKHDIAFPVLGSISDQTIGGLVSTATHGTGLYFNQLSAYLIRLQFLDSDGILKTVSNFDQNCENRDLFYAASVGLGAFGILVTCTFQLEPNYNLTSLQWPTSLNKLLPIYRDLICSAEHVRFWYFPHCGTKNSKSWFSFQNNGNDTVVQAANRLPGHQTYCYDTSVRRKHRKTNSNITLTKSISKRFFFSRYKTISAFLQKYFCKFQESLWKQTLEAFIFITRLFPYSNRYIIPLLNQFQFNQHFCTGNSVENHSKLNSKTKVGNCKQIFNFDCLFDQYVSEQAIDIDKFPYAMTRLRKLIDKNKFYVHFPIEIRFVESDNIQLSPCYKRRSCYIGIIMYRPFGFDVEQRRYFDLFEDLMIELGGRPHQAKDFKLKSRDFSQIYERQNDWLRLRQSIDKHNLFINDYMKRILN